MTDSASRPSVTEKLEHVDAGRRAAIGCSTALALNGPFEKTLLFFSFISTKSVFKWKNWGMLFAYRREFATILLGHLVHVSKE